MTENQNWFAGLFLQAQKRFRFFLSLEYENSFVFSKFRVRKQFQFFFGLTGFSNRLQTCFELLKYSMSFIFIKSKMLTPSLPAPFTRTPTAPISVYYTSVQSIS